MHVEFVGGPRDGYSVEVDEPPMPVIAFSVACPCGAPAVHHLATAEYDSEGNYLRTVPPKTMPAWNWRASMDGVDEVDHV